MSWLDAHEVFLMEVVRRDRVEDLRLALTLAKEPTEEPAEPAGERHVARPAWYRRLSPAA